MKLLIKMGLTALAAMAMLTACHDDDTEQPTPVVPTGPWTVTVVSADDGDDDEPMLYWRAGFESITVSIAGRSGSNPILVSVVDDSSVATDDTWLTVASDTLAADSIVALKTTLNDTGQRRTALLRFTDAADPTVSGTLRVTQYSQSDADSNGDDARSQLYVGYGYDIYKALESPMSVRCKAPILDQSLLRQNSAADRYEIIHDSHMARIDVRYVSSNTVRAFGRDLTEQQTGDEENTIEGCTEDCKTAVKNIDEGKGKLDQQNYGHGSLEKAVYSRVIDRGAIIDQQRKGILGLSEPFKNRLRPVRQATGQQRKDLIEQLLVDFGTHVVLQVDLGGRIDYTFCMSKEASFNSEEEMRQEIDYTLGRIADNDRTEKNRVPTSSKSATGAIVVKGGSDASRRTLHNDIGKLSPTGQLNPTHLTDWLATINYSSNPENDPCLDVIHFELMPVWDLVDDDLRQDFLDVTLKMASRSDCKLPASFLSTDIYEINTEQRRPVNYAQLFNFNTSLQPRIGSLCRLLYFENEPVLQVCSEYVPNIRTDERVTIVYPIYLCNIRMNQGLFLGDGIHQPAYVGFSNGDCYLNPIDSLPPGRIINRFWYVNGNLQLKSPTNEKGRTGKSPIIMEDFLPLYTDDDGGSIKHAHPIVKVGSKFWTRHDIDHRMLFAEDENYAGTDQMEDGFCYVQFTLTSNNKQFKDYNSWVWGYDPNQHYEGSNNMKWFLPTSADVNDLHQFIGFNTKALFKDQVSGWDAQFNGYYGFIDILDQNKRFSDRRRQLRYKGQVNAICSRNGGKESGACLLMLQPDYSLTLINDKTYSSQWRTNFYPVRPMRGFLFRYPTYTDIDQNFVKKSGVMR